MSLANAHPFGMNAGGWHFSHGIEGLGVLNIPSGPPVGEQHIKDVIEVWRRLRSLLGAPERKPRLRAGNLRLHLQRAGTPLCGRDPRRGDLRRGERSLLRYGLRALRRARDRPRARDL